MLALSIRQPYVELILRGIKTIEYRSLSTNIIGERFWIYSTQKIQSLNERKKIRTPAVDHARARKGTELSRPVQLSSDNLSIQAPPPWMLELAEAMRLFPKFADLPRGLIVGSAVIEKVVKREIQIKSQSILGSSRASQFDESDELTTVFEWHLANVEKIKTPMTPSRQPQPVWFRPFESDLTAT